MKILDPCNVLSCWMYVKTLLNEIYLFLDPFFFGMKLKYILKVQFEHATYLCCLCESGYSLYILRWVFPNEIFFLSVSKIRIFPLWTNLWVSFKFLLNRTGFTFVVPRIRNVKFVFYSSEIEVIWLKNVN